MRGSFQTAMRSDPAHRRSVTLSLRDDPLVPVRPTGHRRDEREPVVGDTARLEPDPGQWRFGCGPLPGRIERRLDSRTFGLVEVLPHDRVPDNRDDTRL